jgi:hypothetical protein
MAASVQTVAQNAYRFGDEDSFDLSILSGPEVFTEADFFLAEPTDMEGLMSMSVKLIAVGGQVVFEERSDGGPVALFIQDLDLPDGQYRFEVIAVYDIGVSVTPSFNGRTSRREFGTITIRNSLIKKHGENRERSGDSVSSNHNVSWPVRMAGVALDWLVAASAANDGIQAHGNTCVGDPSCDNSSELTMPLNSTNGEKNDFTVLDNATNGTADFEMINEDGSVLISLGDNLLTTYNDDTQKIMMQLDMAAENALISDSAGDVTLADGTVFIDRGKGMHIGSTAAPEFDGLQVTDDPAIITLTDSNSGNTAYLVEHPGGFGIFNTVGSIGVFGIDPVAPAGSLAIGSNGNIGIGTISPVEAVDVVRSGAASRFQLTSFTSTGNQAAQFVQRRARGTSASPTAVLNGDALGTYSYRGHTGTTFTGSKATISAKATENWSPSANGTRLIFGTTQNGTSTHKVVMEITHDGKVKINGTTLNVPDYVFEEDYPLMPLDELAAYVKNNKHLPGVAPANEVNKEGLDIAGSQLSILEKVEELTLYTLQQHTQLIQLRTANLALQEKVAKVDELENMVNLLIQRQGNDQLLTAVN